MSTPSWTRPPERPSPKLSRTWHFGFGSIGNRIEPACASRRAGLGVTVGFAAGIPKLPLNLVLLKGAAVIGFQFIDYATHLPEEMARNEAELMGLLAAGRATPHVGATFALDDVVDALRYVADGKAVGKVVVDLG